MNIRSTFSQMFRSSRSTLFGIFVIAFLARVLFLGTLPGNFFVDEVLTGYLGRYLWENGIDLYGNAWPLLYFNKFGDYYIILPMYLAGLSTYIFGITEFATRFPTALIGALTIIPVYGIGRSVFKNDRVGLFAALLLAITPWHVVLSRATTESVIELFLLACILWALISIEYSKKRVRVLLLAGVLSLFSYLIYHTARLIVPLLWIGFLGLHWKVLQARKRELALTVGILAVLASVTVLISQTEWGRGRFEQTSLFSELSGVAIQSQEMTFNLGENNILLARIFHNKVLGFGRAFVDGYLEYFSTVFLFTDFGWLNTRYAVPQTGLLFLSTIGMVASLLFSVKRMQLKSGMLFLIWFALIVPIPAALTVLESPNVRRSLALVLPLLLLAAYGWHASFSIRYKQIAFGHLLSLLLLAELVLFSYMYYFQSDYYSARYRNDGDMQSALYVNELQLNDGVIHIFDSIDFPLYYLFVTKNLNRQLSEQFTFGLRIDQIESLRINSHECARDLLPAQYATIASCDILIERSLCEFDSTRFVELERIPHSSILTHHRVMRKVATTQNAASDEKLQECGQF